jgi:hypothetical protein
LRQAATKISAYTAHTHYRDAHKNLLNRILPHYTEGCPFMDGDSQAAENRVQSFLSPAALLGMFRAILPGDCRVLKMDTCREFCLLEKA